MFVKRGLNKVRTLFVYFWNQITKYRNITWKGIPAEVRSIDSIEIDKKSKISIGIKFAMRKNSYIECKDGGELMIGDSVFLNRGCMITCLKSISIGNHCIFGPSVKLYDHDHVFERGGVVPGRYKCGNIVIEDNCWIGAGAVILKNTHIGAGSIIGAGTIVCGDIAQGSIVKSNRQLVISKLKD